MGGNHRQHRVFIDHYRCPLPRHINTAEFADLVVARFVAVLQKASPALRMAAGQEGRAAAPGAG